MTAKIEKKVETLLRITRDNISQVKSKGDSPFATSAAKYYPALKKLASK